LTYWKHQTNAKQGSNFPYPYVDGAVFEEGNLSYSGRLYLWNPNYAIMYGYATPNLHGDVGISVFYGGGKLYPSIAVGIYNNFSNSYNSTSSSIELTPSVIGTSSPRSEDWGDFIRLRSYGGNDMVWISTGFTAVHRNNQDIIQPIYIIFGRAGDMRNLPQ
jgi:hypothetical protein